MTSKYTSPSTTSYTPGSYSSTTNKYTTNTNGTSAYINTQYNPVSPTNYTPYQPSFTSTNKQQTTSTTTGGTYSTYNGSYTPTSYTPTTTSYAKTDYRSTTYQPQSSSYTSYSNYTPYNGQSKPNVVNINQPTVPVKVDETVEILRKITEHQVEKAKIGMSFFEECN